jgi:hypothetical protein
MHDGRCFASAGFFSRDPSGATEIGAEPNAATRLAITRAAAEIGKAMPPARPVETMK